MANNEIVPVSRPVSPLATSSHAADVLESFLRGRKASTIKSYRHDLISFARFLFPGAPEPNPGAAVEAFISLEAGQANQVAMRYLASLNEQGLATATVARRLSALRSMVRIARRIGRVNWMLDLDVPRTVPYRDTRGPSHDAWKTLLGTAVDLAVTPRGRRDLAALLMMHDGGLRRGEVLGLDLVHVELGGEKPGAWIIGKGRTEREFVPISDRTRVALREWVIDRGSTQGPLFTRLDAASVAGQLDRLGGDGLRLRVARLSKVARLAQLVRPHGLRHAAITRLVAKEVGFFDVSTFARHLDPKVTKRYIDNFREGSGHLTQILGDDS
jgi:integrase/recombinase XerC